MNKRQARAVLRMQATVLKAVDKCLEALDERERTYAESYWASHMRSIVNGTGYGSVPIARALDVIES